MGDKKSKKSGAVLDPTHLPQWPGSQFSLIPPPPMENGNKKILSFGNSNKMVSMSEGMIRSIEHDDLKQGSLYIVKIRNVSVSLFQGWDDDMCCFAVLRSDSTPMRWSDARYIPGDFDAYDAFDDAGNPPVHLWSRHLRVNVPVNWFSIFEEGRRKQRSWMNEQNDDYYYPAEQPETPGQPGRHSKGIKASSVTPPHTDKSSANHTPSPSEVDEDDDVSIGSNQEQVEAPSTENKEDEDDDKKSIAEEEAADDDKYQARVLEPSPSPAPAPTPAPAPAPAPIPRTKNTRKPTTSASNSTSANPHPSKSEIIVERSPAKKGVAPAPAAVVVATSNHEPPSTSHSKSIARESAAQPGQDAHRYHHQKNQQEYQTPGPKYLNTPPTSPVNATGTYTNGHQPIYQPQMTDRHGNLFSSTDFAFPHNETQFSIQGNSFPESPIVGGAPSKSMTHVLDAPTKSKRRSMQGFFRK